MQLPAFRKPMRDRRLKVVQWFSCSSGAHIWTHWSHAAAKDTLFGFVRAQPCDEMRGMKSFLAVYAPVIVDKVQGHHFVLWDAISKGYNSCKYRLTMRQYFSRFSPDLFPPPSPQENVIQGIHTLGWGIVNGVAGIVMDPLAGAAEGGVKGFAKGVCTGVVGIVTKPTSGMLECFAKAAHGIGGGIKTLGDEVRCSIG